MGKAFGLHGACLGHALTYGRTTLTLGRALQFFKRHGRYFDLQIDTVHQRTANLRHIALNHTLITTALMRWVVIITTGTRIHSGHEHKRAGQIGAILGAIDIDNSVLQRLAERLERTARKFGQLIKEKYAVMGQRNLARLKIDATSYQSYIGNGVVRTAKGAASDE